MDKRQCVRSCGYVDVYTFCAIVCVHTECKIRSIHLVLPALPCHAHRVPPGNRPDIVRAGVAASLLHGFPLRFHAQRISRHRVAHNRVAAFFQRRAKHINDVLAAPRRVLAHRRIINLYAVLSSRPPPGQPLPAAPAHRAHPAGQYHPWGQPGQFRQQAPARRYRPSRLVHPERPAHLGGRAFRCRPSRPVGLADQVAPVAPVGP